MDETILLPSPNWFQVNGLAVSSDGWLIYGGPSKSLCVVQPLPSNYDAVVSGWTGYTAHVINRAHYEKIVSVDVSPEWPEKRGFVTGSVDGSVKQWLVSEQDGNVIVKATLAHDVHTNEKEEIAGVGYSNETYVITVGSFGNIVKWDTNSNVTKTYNKFLKNFRPTNMRCSPHISLNVAIGTKQGVIFVLDLTEHGKIVYKIRGHDDEIMQLSWCPQYKVEVRKALNTTLAARLNSIRKKSENSNEDNKLSQVVSTEKFATVDFKTSDKVDTSKLVTADAKPPVKLDTFNSPSSSNAAKGLNSSEDPDTTVVEEVDLFDMYKDHAAEEFGHKKYEPEDIYVKIKSESTEPDNYLAECLKLKDVILKNKEESEATIESLVEALDKTHVENVVTGAVKNDDKDDDDETYITDDVSSIHKHRHLLVTIGKLGSIRIWSKTGKLVSSSSVSQGNMKSTSKVINCITVLWYKPDCLLIADGRSQLLGCNPLKINSKSKIEWHILHSSHRRGLYCIASGAPRVQTETHDAQHWPVWTAGQDRTMVEYCLKERKVKSVRATVGSFVYCAAVCPYDAKKVAVSVSDGAVRVWEADTLQNDDSKLTPGHIAMYWHNVQGKVYTVAWHPTRENLLAYATAEARVGLIDTSGKGEKPAKVLRPALTNAVYGLCWGERNTLYACGGGELVAYDTSRVDDAPKHIKVELEGVQLKMTEVVWSERAMLIGSMEGAVAILTARAPHTVVTAAFPFNKMIHKLEWHPQQVSESSEESPNKDLIAACSLDKTHNVVILQLGENEEGEIILRTYKTLSGHKNPVNRVCWNPHREGLLMSASQDCTVRIWDVLEGVCTSIFGGHKSTTLGIAWCGHPALWDIALTGGGDQTLRIWRISDNLAENYMETLRDTTVPKKERRRKQDKLLEKATEISESIHATESDQQIAAHIESKLKIPKKFLLPRITKQIADENLSACRAILEKYIYKASCANGTEPNGYSDNIWDDGEYVPDFIKIFGSINDVNEIMDKELLKHEESGHFDGWVILSIFRGNIDSVFQYAAQRDLICPYLLSVAPCVSFKYWKDASQMYLSQIDRLVAKGDAAKLAEGKSFGGPVFRKATTLLSMHDVKGALAVLTDARLFKEAYVLCRVRHLDSIAEEMLRRWAQHTLDSGSILTAAICSIALGDLTQAAVALGRSNNEEYLSLAAEVAKLSGQKTYAIHIQQRTEQIRSDNQSVKNVDEELEKLPTRIELLMKQIDLNGGGDGVRVDD